MILVINNLRILMNEVDLVTIRSMIIVNSAHIEYEKAAVSRTLVKFISVTKKKRGII